MSMVAASNNSADFIDGALVPRITPEAAEALAELRATNSELADMVEAGSMTIPTASALSKLPAAKLADALRQIKAGRRSGKL